MKSSIENILQQGIAAHDAGNLQEAERAYRVVLDSQPKHPDANYNLGLIAISANQLDVALSLFKIALEVNPNYEKFWTSYIDALIQNEQLEDAKRAIKKAGKKGFDAKKMHILFSQSKRVVDTKAPSQAQLTSLMELYQNRRFSDAEKLAVHVTQDFPRHQFAWKVLGAILGATGRKSEALVASQTAVALSPQDPEAQYNLGNKLKKLGRLDEAKASFNQAIALKPDYAEAHSNLGNTFKDLGRLDEAEASYNHAIALKPDFANVYWNLHGIQKTIKGAEYWIDKCLEVDEKYEEAMLTKAAFRFYQGDKYYFDNFMQSELKEHAYMRSFFWVFSLPQLPELHFNKYYFFDAVTGKSITSRPFYEFGVWRASSFKYLIKAYKKGYGFDTFTGLPEEWDVGHHIENAGNYTSDGNVPKIKGGEFIVGKFEDTLPIFFSEDRPVASVINFDADLYSSTICALNYSKSVMDKNTILIFDEFIINESWEQDEFKALNEFCSINHYSYEVIAISFFTKQVAVKLIGV